MNAGMTQDAMEASTGEALITLLEKYDVDVVFGIPGVHTAELYRGLAGSKVRHVTPRHEQGAGFMADGYARVSGKPGVCLVITGPGLTNTITAMAQARADSVPMLVISGVGRRGSLGHGRGALHELPDQRAMMASFALFSHTLLSASDLPGVMARAFAILNSGRPGPVHIEIPVDVMQERVAALPARVPALPSNPHPGRGDLEAAARLLSEARRPAIIVGGGARRANDDVTALAERLDAPVVTTANARGLLAGHPLRVPASPSLKAVRAFLAECDAVLALGTEMGPTDFDVYEDGGFPTLKGLVRVDIDAGQLARGPRAEMAILGDARATAAELCGALGAAKIGGERRGEDMARRLRAAAFEEIGDAYRGEVAILDAIRETLPGALFVGDSTQPVYAGNLYCDIDTPAGWFNSATGFGALGYGVPAAIGAAIADPDRLVVALLGDGGLQFSLAELGSAIDAGTPVIFIVWNNFGFREIETFMIERGIAPEGVKPTPPDFDSVAKAYGLAFERPMKLSDLPASLRRARDSGRAALIELRMPFDM
ncbi:5-guanidino-2-oxopentanoate decarboxylase [Afifella sp. JA880]|uniref:5-guanidino-2-oxopentanoate decarboxylase n=1 Tax=Afifella sp. JA880 TaxID=2975280 RepID=UPI0039648748